MRWQCETAFLAPCVDLTKREVWELSNDVPKSTTFSGKLEAYPTIFMHRWGSLSGLAWCLLVQPTNGPVTHQNSLETAIGVWLIPIPDRSKRCVGFFPWLQHRKRARGRQQENKGCSCPPSVVARADVFCAEIGTTGSWTSWQGGSFDLEVLSIVRCGFDG